MKHFVLAIFLLLGASSVQAQQKVEVFKGLIYIKQNKAEVINDTVYWEMDMYISGITVARNQSMLVIPVLSNGKDSLVLAPVVLNGSGKNIVYNRKKSLQEKSLQAMPGATILKNDQSKIVVVSLTQQFPFQPWMTDAGFKLIGKLEDFNGKPIATYTDILSEDLKLK